MGHSRRGQDVVWKNLRLVLFEWTGSEWKERGTFASDCMNNFPPQRLDGVYAMPCGDSRMNVFMALSAQPESNNLTRSPLSADPPFHRMDEPTLYETADGFTHMILRDNNRSRRLIRALSRDHGRTRSAPVLTDYPDATNKNFTGRLTSGSYFLINNPDTARCDPLAISFRPDGRLFSNPVAIWRGAPPRRPQISGQGSFQYPHAIEHAGSLWVVYSTNKQAIEITRLPLDKPEVR